MSRITQNERLSLKFLYGLALGQGGDISLGFGGDTDLESMTSNLGFDYSALVGSV